MAKDNKKSNKSYETVLLEDLKGQFKAFGEGLGTLSEQFEDFKVKQDVLTGKVEKLEDGQKILTGKVEKLEIGQKVLAGKVEKLEEGQKILTKKVDGLQSDVTEIKHKLSKKVDIEDFQKLEKRVIKLEKMMLSMA